MNTNWGRLMTAMITPYDTNGNVDYEKAAHLANGLFKNGSDGLVLWGTTGESPVLSNNEKERLFNTIKEKSECSGPIILGTGTNETKKTIEMNTLASKLGADGVMVVAPYYNKPSQKGLYEHYREIAESTDLPIMIYNIPGRTGVTISTETVARLSEITNIVAIKEAAGDIMQVTALREVLPKDFLIYSGDDALTLPMLSVGAHGVISVASHILARPLQDMINSFIKGDVNQALETHERLMPIFNALFYDVNPVPVKVMLDYLGFSTGGLRLPLVESEDSTKEQILKPLKTFTKRNELVNTFLGVPVSEL